MVSFKKSIIGLGIFFAILALVIFNSPTAVANIAFMSICYVVRNPIKSIFSRLIANRFLRLVIFGTLLGMAEETLWYFGHMLEAKPQPWVSLIDDFIRMAPAYFVLFVFIYLLVKLYHPTAKQAFTYGAAMGYVIYFIMEGAEIGFSPLPLLLLWEINNFLLNGFLVWMPLYVSDVLAECKDCSMKEHIFISILLLAATVAAMLITMAALSAVSYTPVAIGP